MKEPARLCESDDFPPALRDAFRALEQDAPSAETVLRVQRSLQALPAASTGAAVTATFGTTKLWLVSTLIAGAATFAVLNQSRVEGPRSEGEASVPVAKQSAVSDAVPNVVHAPAATRATDDAEHAASRAHQPSAEQQPSQLSTPVAAKGGELAAPPRARSDARAKALRIDVSAQRNTIAAARSARGDSALLLAPSEPSSSQEPAPERAAEPASAPQAKTDEATLLAQAKRLSSSDPAAALRQVELLSQRYPAGTFVQERELLAIQLHQRLGHAAAAEQLIRRFHERFPNSVYRRALPP